MNPLIDLPARQLGRMVLDRETTAREICTAFLERAQATEPRVGAFLHLDPEAMLAQASQIDGRRDSGERLSKLAGVPVAVKDNLCTAGTPTTAGSRILRDYRPPRDAAVVERLRQGGCLPFGKTNCDEFSMGSSTENSAQGRTTNPWSEAHVPGGSSGGSAAAVAARSAPLALGSDTGGSIRQPAAFCGVVGFKPTYGRVSRRGLVAFASSLDQVGPFARNVADAAAVLELIAGPDPEDSTCTSEHAPDFLTAETPTSFRFGVPRELLSDGLADDVRREVENAFETLTAIGGELVDVPLAHCGVAVATYQIVSTAEASSNLARHDGVRYGRRSVGATDIAELVQRSRAEALGAEVKRRILLGAHVLSAGYHDAYYRHANKVRSLISRDFDEAFGTCDVVVMPTAPTTAFRLGEKVGDPLSMYLSDVYTVPCNLAGLPGLSLPCGVGDDGLPVGLQLLAPRWEEGRLVAIAHELETALGFEVNHALPD